MQLYFLQRVLAWVKLELEAVPPVELLPAPLVELRVVLRVVLLLAPLVELLLAFLRKNSRGFPFSQTHASADLPYKGCFPPPERRNLYRTRLVNLRTSGRNTLTLSPREDKRSLCFLTYPCRSNGSGLNSNPCQLYLAHLRIC